MSDFPGLVVVELRCEHQIAPLGIGTARPRLSWELRSARGGARQSAWQVELRAGEGYWSGEGAGAIVGVGAGEGADSRSGPGSGAGAGVGTSVLAWDSGKRPGDGNLVRYEGPALVSRVTYFWRLRVWDEFDAVSDWSPESSWEMALLDPADWEASWIEPLQDAAKPELPMTIQEMLEPEDRAALDRRDSLRPCQMVRRSFFVAKAVRRARLYATAHGIYHPTINGKAIDSRAFAPEPSAYNSQLYYQTYDVGGLLNQGGAGEASENVIGFVLADGWWAGRIGLPGASCQYGDRLALLFQLEINYEDGSSCLVVSDENCRAGRGPWDYADIFVGERYDARRCLPGWDRPGFDDGAWARAEVRDYGLANLLPQHGEPVRPLSELGVARVIRTPRGETVLDFGQVIAGRVRFRCARPAGWVITLEHGECLDQEGNFFSNIIGRNKDQEDIYVCAGGEDEEWEPRFTYHGFRYVRVEGDAREGLETRYVAVVLGSDLRRAGTFACSDSRINQLYENIVWSQRGNFFSIPTDCPQRERAGFTGDAQIFAETAAFNMDVEVFFERFLRTIVAEQLPDGQVPNLVPYWKSYIETFYPMQGSHGSAGWGDAVILVPWRLYRMRGDRSLLEDNYPAMRAWVAYMEGEAATGCPEPGEGRDNSTWREDPAWRERQRYLWNTGFQFGDWLAPGKLMAGLDPFAIAASTREIVATCSFAYSVGIMITIATTLGETEDAKNYRLLFEAIQKAFGEEYLEPSGTLKADFQGAFILSLASGLIPAEGRPRVLAQLVESIEAFGGRLDAGFVSIPFLMDVLTDGGLVERAYDLLFQTECPSWLYEVERGATTMWESWSGIAPDGRVGAFSFNHYAFGCVGQWLYRAVAGIQALEPGFKRILVLPRLDARLSWAEASHHSPHGLIRVRWEREGDRVRLDLVIPQGTEAEVRLPGARLLRHAESIGVGEGGQPDPGRTETLVLQSGRHSLSLQL